MESEPEELCTEYVVDGDDNQPGAPTKAEAIDLFLENVELPRDAHVDGTVIYLERDRIGSITVTSPSAGGYYVTEAKWCLDSQTSDS